MARENVMILADNVTYSLDDFQTGLNNNVAVVESGLRQDQEHCDSQSFVLYGKLCHFRP